MSGIIIDDLDSSMIEEYKNHKKSYNEIFKKLLAPTIKRKTTVSDFNDDEDLTSEEMAELKRRLKNKKVANVDIFEFLNELKASKKN